MQELIKKITETAGISDEQAVKAVDAVKEFVIEKFPMLAGAVENMFGAAAPAGSSASAPKAADEPLK
jgi:hypothetical protein